VKLYTSIWVMMLISAQVPTKPVTFSFPAEYDDTRAIGDKLWNELMPREDVEV
jgi:hypothetical protein